MARDFREFQSRARAYKLWLTVIHQNMHQLESSLRVGLWSVGNQFIMRQLEIESALESARNLTAFDPFLAKYDRHEDRTNPTAMALPDQDRIYANWLQNAPDRKGLFRIADRGRWKRGTASTPALNLSGMSAEAAEAARRQSLARFARPVSALLDEVRARQAGALSLARAKHEVA